MDNWTFSEDRGFGHAARRNRGHYTGAKIHLISALIVSAKPEGHVDRPREIRVGQTYCAFAECGVTQGQFAGRIDPALTAESVSCTRCLRILHAYRDAGRDWLSERRSI